MPKTIRAITPQPEESPVTMEKKSIRAPQVGMIGIDRWTDNPVIEPYKSTLPTEIPASSIKRTQSVPKEQLMEAIQRKLGTSMQKVPDYTYNTEMPAIPSSRDKMYEMAIARRSSTGSRLPSPKFSTGGFNGI